MSSALAASDATLNASYDEVPYESFTYAHTHPEHMSVVGTLFGLTPPDFRTARVLELGCAGGGNLCPQALLYPQAQFTGLDFSAEQIALANEEKAALGLTNIEFRQEDILNFDLQKNKEKFDFIICHGVFSWVPEVVRNRILALISTALVPEGLALVSYNTLPGWNAIRSLREMMIYHTARFEKPQEKIQQSRALLDFLLDTVPAGNASYHALIENERKLLQSVNDTYLFHEHLENVNTQFYLHDFVRMANTEGLTYVGDANISGMFIDSMPAKAIPTLKMLNDIVAQEQYMDFVRNRRFRSSILCKDARKLNRNLRTTQIMDYRLATRLDVPEGEPDLSKDFVFKVEHTQQTVMTHDLRSGTLFLELAKSGRLTISPEDLIARVQEKLGLSSPDPIRDVLHQNGLKMAMHGYFTLHLEEPRLTLDISDKPVAYPIARRQAQRNSYQITNVLYDVVNTGDIVNTILRHLDGTRTVNDIADILYHDVQAGRLNINKGNVRLTNPEDIRESLLIIVAETMPKLALQGLLVG